MGAKPGILAFDSAPFGEGSSRLAFRCKVAEGNYKGFPTNTELVLKAMKPELYERGIRVSDRDVEMQRKAADLAQEFNRFMQPKKHGRSCNVHMLETKLGTMTGHKVTSTGKVIIRDGEGFLLEQMIIGEFDKFNSNSGWSCGTAKLPDFFSHWTWVHTGGRYLVCDLQGHRGRPGGPLYQGESYYYLLTDPAICSFERKFGITDLGKQGIKNWFAHHVCNELCETHGLVQARPASPMTMRSARATLIARRRSSYVDEMCHATC
mmetsp:Transcript_9043/g.16600  ORF Transcript_9043/g.16600 Transcript_9043/m.16600 type:complete len:264 (+) Transcript_9043:55-846(+)